MHFHDQDDDRRSNLVWGLGFVVAGVVILLQSLGVMPFALWRHWWPLFMVGIGGAQMVSSRTAKSLGDGVSLTLLGCWCFVATNELWGLTFRTSWPLALVATGLGMVVRAATAGLYRRRENAGEVRLDG